MIMKRSKSKFEMNTREIQKGVLLFAFEMIVFIDSLCEYRRYAQHFCTVVSQNKILYVEKLFDECDDNFVEFF